MQDMINHPDHYTQGIECWDYITSHKMGYLEGNIIKYVTRYKGKGGLEDLFKAKAYLQRLIQLAQDETPLVEQPLCGCDGEIPHYPCTKDRTVWSKLEVQRLNGAIPLPAPAPELWHGFPLGFVLDGRNCPPTCDCSDHQCPGEPQARPAITGDDAPEAEEHSFLAQPAKYYDDDCPF